MNFSLQRRQVPSFLGSTNIILCNNKITMFSFQIIQKLLILLGLSPLGQMKLTTLTTMVITCSKFQKEFLRKFSWWDDAVENHHWIISALLIWAMWILFSHRFSTIRGYNRQYCWSLTHVYPKFILELNTNLFLKL